MIWYRRDLDRGVVILQQQVRELSRDLAELKGETTAWQAGHTEQHKSDETARISGRRWLITTWLACMAIVVTLLVAILARVR